MADILSRIYASKRARAVIVTPKSGAPAFERPAIVVDEAGAVWETINPQFRFLRPVDISEGDSIVFADTGASFRAYEVDGSPFGRETIVTAERETDVFDAPEAYLYRSPHAIKGSLEGTATTVLLSMQPSVRRLDYGRARGVLIARAQHTDFEEDPDEGQTLDLADGRTFTVHGVEALFRSGEWRLVLEQ